MHSKRDRMILVSYNSNGLTIVSCHNDDIIPEVILTPPGHV